MSNKDYDKVYKECKQLRHDIRYEQQHSAHMFKKLYEMYDAYNRLEEEYSHLFDTRADIALENALLRAELQYLKHENDKLRAHVSSDTTLPPPLAVGVPIPTSPEGGGVGGVSLILGVYLMIVGISHRFKQWLSS